MEYFGGAVSWEDAIGFYAVEASERADQSLARGARILPRDSCDIRQRPPR
jgi:hypothetical protein